MLIDSHCHLNHKRLLTIGGPDAAVKNARAAGIGGMLTICCHLPEWDEVRSIVRAHDNVWCTVGVHPHDAGEEYAKALSQEKLVALARSEPKIVGIGESGLDYFYKNSAVDQQQRSFRQHIRACIETGLPLVVHARDADEDIMRIIREEGTGTELKGVMHCFSSGRKMGEDALEFGFYISFSGIVTFKKSDGLRDFARAVPQDRILVETDAPYLAPEPDRGRINEPALVSYTARQIAGLKGITEEQLAITTTENFFRLFNRAKYGA
jgi:TatD DNase family protein